jgi:hypothetical protein
LSGWLFQIKYDLAQAFMKKHGMISAGRPKRIQRRITGIFKKDWRILIRTSGRTIYTL